MAIGIKVLNNKEQRAKTVETLKRTLDKNPDKETIKNTYIGAIKTQFRCGDISEDEAFEKLESFGITREALIAAKNK